MSRSQFRSRDGLRIAVEASGPEAAPAIVFIHGFAQSREAFRSVLEGPLAEDHRLVAFDLRGHGESEVPPPERAAGAWLGEDLAAVIDALQLKRPILAPWSYGGVVAGEYLRATERDVGGILFLAAAVAVGKPARQYFGATMMNHARGLLSDDASTYEAAARAFAAGCAELDPATTESLVLPMLGVPVHVRRALLASGESYFDDFARVTAPKATLHGTHDTVVLPSMSEALRDADVTRLEGLGHLTWLEAPDAFTRAVRELTSRASGLLDGHS